MKKGIAFFFAFLCSLCICAKDYSNLEHFDLTLTEAGTLNEIIGGVVTTSSPYALSVAGPINDKDIEALHRYGQDKLWVLDLANAQIEDNILPDYAFATMFETDGLRYWNPNIKKIILPEGLLEIGECAFKDYFGLEEVVLPSSLKKIGDYAFAGCTGLTEIVLPASLETIDVASFSGCTSLQKVDLPSSLKKIRRYAFDGSGLQSIDFPDGLKEIGKNAFSNTKLERVEIPESCIYLREAAFESDSLLKEAIVPSSVKKIPVACFRNCVSIEKFEIAEGISLVDAFAFENCTSLKELKLAESVKFYNQKAFYNHAMEELHLPEYFYGRMVGIKAFYGAKPLTKIYSESKITPYFNYFDSYDSECPLGLNTASRDLPIYVPVGTAKNYRMGLGWSFFTNFIETEDFPTSGVADVESTGGIRVENGVVLNDGAEIVKIYNLNGVEIYSGNDRSISGLQPGIYLISLKDSQPQKIIIK